MKVTTPKVLPFNAAQLKASPQAEAKEAPAQTDAFRPAEGEEEPAPPPPQFFKHNFFSQDALAEQMITTESPKEGVTAGPANARLRVVDPENEQANFDENGDMLYLANDPRFNQVQTFVAADRADDFFNEMLGREAGWAFSSEQLKVKPHGGEMLNAYYSRNDGSINFFEHFNTRMNKMVDSGMSAEVVYHEMGHALLDAVRPGWIRSYRGATGGIHEGFGDMLSTLVGLRDPRNLDKVIAETGGDLWQDNSMSRLAEELGRSIFDERGQQRPHHDYLRNSRNNLINADPNTLPWRPPNEEDLGAEPHNYSRVISAAVYDVLASLNDQFQAQGFGVRESIEKARDVTAELVIKAFDFTPAGSLPSYGHFAAGMLAVDQAEFGGKYGDTVTNMMAARNIHPPAPEPPPEEGIALPENVNAASMLALVEGNRENLGIGGLPLEFQSANTDDKGRTFVTFTYEHSVPVELPGNLSEAVVKEKGGLVLAFGDDGQLFYKNTNKITKEDEKEIRRSVQQNFEEGMINTGSIFQSEPSVNSLFKTQHVPFRGYVSQENGELVIKRSPIVD